MDAWFVTGDLAFCNQTASSLLSIDSCGVATRGINDIMTRDQLARQIYTASNITGTFQLRSGAVSNEYFDKYRFEADPNLLSAIAHALHALIPPEVDALAGLELGGIPLVTILSQISGRPARFVRKAAKSYGTCQLAEGGDIAGYRLVLVEDVVTSGGADHRIHPRPATFGRTDHACPVCH